jgi:hypothetical protein
MTNFLEEMERYKALDKSQNRRTAAVQGLQNRISLALPTFPTQDIVLQ